MFEGLVQAISQGCPNLQSLTLRDLTHEGDPSELLLDYLFGQPFANLLHLHLYLELDEDAQAPYVLNNVGKYMPRLQVLDMIGYTPVAFENAVFNQLLSLGHCWSPPVWPVMPSLTQLDIRCPTANISNLSSLVHSPNIEQLRIRIEIEDNLQALEPCTSSTLRLPQVRSILLDVYWAMEKVKDYLPCSVSCSQWSGHL